MIKTETNKTKHIVMPKDHMEKLYNSKNPLIRFVHRSRIDTILSQIPNKDNLKILDAGCGEGQLLEKIHEKHKTNNYYGIDITDVALNRSKKRCPFAKIKKMDLSKIEFNNESFDVVICTETIEHIIEYEKVIKELERVLKKGGYLIITFPNEILWTISRFLLGRKPIKVPDHVNSFTPKKIKQLIKLKLKNHFNLPFNLPFFISLGCLMRFKK